MRAAIPVVLTSVVLSCAGAYLVTRFAGPAAPPARSPAGVDSSGLAEPGEPVAETRRALVELRSRLEDLERGAARSPAAGVDATAVRDAVHEWLDAHASELGSFAQDAADGTGVTVDALLTRYADPKLSDAERQEIWREAAAAGVLWDVLAVFESRATQNPDVSQVHCDLGSAYLQALQHVDNPMKQGDLATKADLAFDRSLELDERNWPARFQKALALSFWPAFLGKKAESIRQFEILVEQQETMPKNAEHAQTYLYLGNMYEEAGKADAARTMWQRGLRSYPEDSQLRSRVSSSR